MSVDGNTPASDLRSVWLARQTEFEERAQEAVQIELRAVFRRFAVEYGKRADGPSDG
jgi:hypothetical protein